MTGSRGPLSRDHGARALETAPATELLGEAPADLGEYGRALWDLTVDLASEWLTALDAPALASLCRLEDEHALCREAIEAHGIVTEEAITTTRGEVVGSRLVVNPASVAARKIEASQSVLRKQLNLPLADRARLGRKVLSLRKAAAEAESRNTGAKAGLLRMLKEEKETHADQ